MEYLKIAVVSPDEAYNRVLCMSLLHACRQVDVSAYTGRQFLLEWTDYTGPGAFYNCFDLILWAGDEIRDYYRDNIVYLTDRESLTEMDYTGGRFSLYRYVPTASIVAKVFDIYAHLTGRQFPLVKRGDVSVFAFASYCGGSGCTTIARSFCQELARFRGKRVLCISLEDVESAGDFLTIPEGIRTEGEYLYRLLSKSTRPFMDSYLVDDAFGVSSFAASGGGNPLRDLSGEDVQTFLAALMDSGRFDVIVADLSTCLCEAATTIMDVAEKICIVGKTAQPSVREKNYMNQLLSSCGEETAGNLIRMENEISADRCIDISAPLEGSFGQVISNLTERLVNVVK